MHFAVHLLVSVAAAYYTNIASSVVTSANILEERVLWYSAGDGVAGAVDIGSSITPFSRDLVSLKSELSSIDLDGGYWTTLQVVISNVANSISGLLEEFTAKAQIFEAEGAALVVRDEISSFWQPTAEIIDYAFNLNLAACYPLAHMQADVSALNEAFLSAGSAYGISPLITLPTMPCTPSSITLTASATEVTSAQDDSSQEPPTYTYTGEITTSSFIYTFSAEPSSTPSRCRVRPQS